MDLLMEIFEAKIEFNWDIELAAAGRAANWQEQGLTRERLTLSQNSFYEEKTLLTSAAAAAEEKPAGPVDKRRRISDG